MLLYLVLVVVYRPYKSCFSNLSVIFNECLALIAVSLALANKFFTIDSNTEAFILFNMQGSSSSASSSRSSEFSFTFEVSPERKRKKGNKHNLSQRRPKAVTLSELTE